MKLKLGVAVLLLALYGASLCLSPGDECTPPTDMIWPGYDGDPAGQSAKAQSSFDTNVWISSETWYNADDTSFHYSEIAWPGLEGHTLIIFTNMSAIIEYRFWDAFGDLPVGDGLNVEFEEDRIYVQLRDDAMYYEILSEYHPDLTSNSGFIVVFDTTWDMFGFAAGEGEEAYAKVDIDLKFWLPEGAALVSYAPEDAEVSKKGERYGVFWSYRDREMDPYHDPLTYEITYVFDDLFLKWADLMFQNQKEIQRLEDTKRRNQNLSFALRVVALLGIVLSILAALLAWLLTKLQFRQQLKKARDLPRTLIRDVERELKPQAKIKTLLAITLIAASLWLPVAVAATSPTSMSTSLSSPTTASGIDLQSFTIPEASEDVVVWEGTIDLQRDLSSVETVFINFPIDQSRVYVWANTSEIDEFSAFTTSGVELSFEEKPDRYIINNVGTGFGYQIKRPYRVSNNSGILVYIDRFWLNYVDPDMEGELNPYYHADITYRVLLPRDALIYSASPSAILTRDETASGRERITYEDFDREIDAMHDMFSMQVTYTFTEILDAIEDQSALFDHLKVAEEQVEELETETLRDVVLFSIISLIAPIVSFLISYYVFRKRMLKQISDEQKKYEHIVFAEGAQIEAAKATLDASPHDRNRKAIQGSYFELLARISAHIGRSLFNMPKYEILRFGTATLPTITRPDFVQLVETGHSVAKITTMTIGANEAIKYVNSTRKLLSTLERGK